MRIATDRPQAPTAIRTNLGATFLSMDLSRTTGCSRHYRQAMANGCQSTRCAAAMSLGCWRGSPSLRTKYGSGQGRSFRSSLCKMKGSKATSSIPPRSRCPAGADKRRLTRSTENPWCARCWRINEVSRECAPWSRRRPRKRRIAGAGAGGDVEEFEGHWSGIRRCPVVGRTVPQLLQSTAGRCLCGVGADALAKRVRRSRTGRLQSREPAAANNDDPACLAVGETSAGFDTGTVVPSKGPVQWRPNPEGTDRCLGPKAADRLLEICDRRDRTGRSRDSGCLSTSAPQSSGARSAPADPGERTEIWPGSKSRKREWFRSPEPLPDARGIGEPTRESGDRM